MLTVHCATLRHTNQNYLGNLEKMQVVYCWGALISTLAGCGVF